MNDYGVKLSDKGSCSLKLSNDAKMIRFSRSAMARLASDIIEVCLP